jgi:hypothetical protein
MSAAGKKLEFLREAVPHLHRLAIMTNVGNPASVLEMGEAQAAAHKLSLEVTTSEIRRAFANRCAAMLRASGAASTCIGQCRPSSRIVRVGAARPNSSRERIDQVEPITAASVWSSSRRTGKGSRGEQGRRVSAPGTTVPKDGGHV